LAEEPFFGRVNAGVGALPGGPSGLSSIAPAPLTEPPRVMVPIALPIPKRKF
jgi:hypothetical protein